MRVSAALPFREFVAKCSLDDQLYIDQAHAPIMGEFPDQIGDGRVLRSVEWPVVEFVAVRMWVHRQCKGTIRAGAIRPVKRTGLALPLFAGTAAASNYCPGASQDRSSSSVPPPRSSFTGSILTIVRLLPAVWKNDSSRSA